MIWAGFVLAFAVSALIGGPLIGWLKRVGARQTVSENAPASHAAKQGTPTMGGLIILAGIAVPVAAEAIVRPGHVTVLALLALTAAFALIGFLDDYLIATRGKNLGLKARQKLVLQFVFAIAFCWWLSAANPDRGSALTGRTTFIRLGAEVDLGTAYYALGVLLIVAMSNALNLADGLDGLAAGVTSIIAIGLALLVSAPWSSGFGWLPMFGGAIAGACGGFLWYNAHPAQVFMGDTGALPLGAALAGMAMLGKTEAPFVVMAVIPWAAAISVIVQVTVFQYRARRFGIEYARSHRVFRRTPIHHHFEEIGWAETSIVQRFWLVTAVAVAGMLALAVGR